MNAPLNSSGSVAAEPEHRLSSGRPDVAGVDHAPGPAAGDGSGNLPSLTLAAARASQWLSIARPIILAIFAMEDVEHLLRRAQYSAERQSDSRTFKEAAGAVDRSQRDLNDMLEGIRDDFLADEMPPQPLQGAPDSEWEARDEFSDDLGEAVISVEAAIKIVTDEHNAGFGI